jgi:diadenosine tetraphosphate (Ap4A) HIT family hydrolase
MNHCQLCNNEEEEILWQDRHCHIVLVKEPDYPGFCRVIANQHVKEMTDLDQAIRQHIMAVVFAVEKALRDTLNPDKINLASLGNQVPHIHWHIIPRYQDDPHFPAPIWAKAERHRQKKAQTSLSGLIETIKQLKISS